MVYLSSIVAAFAVVGPSLVNGFVPNPNVISNHHHYNSYIRDSNGYISLLALDDGNSNENDSKNGRTTKIEMMDSNRRSVMTTCIATLVAGISGMPSVASAGIDVSGLRVDGGGGGNPSIASQLKAYDGSGSARVREIQSMSSSSSGTRPVPSSAPSLVVEDDRSPIATWAYRNNPGLTASVSRAGALGTLYRYNDAVIAPTGSKRRAVNIQFEFPSDWLQLDRALGCIQYVDQRNGDKLYVLRAPLPEGSSLETISKSALGDMIFSLNGSLIKSGQTVEDYKVTSAQVLSDCLPGTCATRRRFKIKYATVTGNGLTVERRGLVDAYEVENDIYMLMTSSNAVKFDKRDSIERETVENIVSSFVVDV